MSFLDSWYKPVSSNEAYLILKIFKREATSGLRDRGDLHKSSVAAAAAGQTLPAQPGHKLVPAKTIHNIYVQMDQVLMKLVYH